MRVIGRPRASAAWCCAASLGALALAGCGASAGGGTTARAGTTAATRPPAVRTRPVALRLAARATLPVPVQLPGLAVAGGRLLAAGGLSAADASVADVVAVAGTGVAAPRTFTTLPQAIHDMGAAGIAGRLFVFGGGSASGPTAAIEAIDPDGHVSAAGKLPSPSSDLEAARIGSTVYLVGGYTGSVPLRSVLAFAPGRSIRAVGTLPHPLRYAAVAAVGGRLLIAGGSDGTHARSEIVSFDPASGRARTIGALPAPLAHAAGASLGGTFYVLGGRGDGLASQRREIRAIDPVSGRVRRAGHLPVALSDLSAAAFGDRIWVVGGRDAAGTVHDEAWAFAPHATTSRTTSTTPVARADVTPPPGRIPPLLSPTNVYAAERPGPLAAAARHARPLVYVPNSESGTVDVISQRSGRIIDHFAVGRLPQHVTPSWDLRTLWVTNDLGNSLTPIDPLTGKPGRPVPVLDPYNLYFTADGLRAIVVAEAHKELDFREPHTMKLRHALHVPQCPGVDHMDYTADGRTALVSCEFGADMIVVDLVHERVLRTIHLRPGSKPQDVKLSPDGRVFYVADMTANGVWLIDARTWRVLRLQPTGRGAHGLYPSRDARTLYVTNRDEGTISLISFRTRRPYRKWTIPGGSPDMGGLSASGRVLWLGGRYGGEVYAIDTRTGRVVHRVKVGSGPHGLAVWPQPGRYSIGHTGILR